MIGNKLLYVTICIKKSFNTKTISFIDYVGSYRFFIQFDNITQILIDVEFVLDRKKRFYFFLPN